LAIVQVPVPAFSVTVQVAVLTFTVTTLPLGTASPLWVVTVTVKTAADSSPWVTLVGDSETLVVVVSLVTERRVAGVEVEAV
jgi:hypothetical protein